MKKININYAHANKSWAIGYILKALGFTRTANSYWVETYANAENSVEVNLYLEERKPETPATEWQPEVLNAVGLVLDTDPTASINRRFWAITESGEILHIMPEGAKWEGTGKMLDRYIEAGHFDAGITGIFDKMPEDPETESEYPECHWFEFPGDNEEEYKREVRRSEIEFDREKGGFTCNNGYAVFVSRTENSATFELYDEDGEFFKLVQMQFATESELLDFLDPARFAETPSLQDVFGNHAEEQTEEQPTAEQEQAEEEQPTAEPTAEQTTTEQQTEERQQQLKPRKPKKYHELIDMIINADESELSEIFCEIDFAYQHDKIKPLENDQLYALINRIF